MGSEARQRVLRPSLGPVEGRLEAGVWLGLWENKLRSWENRLGPWIALLVVVVVVVVVDGKGAGFANRRTAAFVEIILRYSPV